LASVLIFIITILLLAADFYYLKNIAGRRLVGLRWWNEVDPQSGDSQWVFESSDPAVKTVNATDSRFFWMALYVHPLLWLALAIFAMVRLQFIWLSLVGECLFSFMFTRSIVMAEGMGSCGRRREGDIGDDWLISVVIALVLTITNTLAFSRCDKFSHASNLAGSALYSGGMARNIAGGMLSRMFRSGN
jgi:hypothetical protein